MLKFLINLFHTNQFFSGAFVISILGGILIYFKTVPVYIYDQIKKRVVHNVNIYQYDELFFHFETWFYENFKHKYRDTEASVKLDSTNSIRDSAFAIPEYEQQSNSKTLKNTIFYKQSQGGFLIKYKGKRLWIAKNKKELNNTNDIRNAFLNHFTISGFKAKYVIDELLTEIMDLAIEKSDKNVIKLYTNDRDGYWCMSGFIHGKLLDNVVLPPEIKEDIKENIANFLSSEEWYIKRGIMYKKTHVYEGSAGSGKTSLALALANHMKRSIYALDLKILSDNSDLRDALKNLDENSILLIEDIDSYFNGRQSFTSIDFSTFINCLDGAFHKHGLFTIITTNHIELMDEALLRTGRVDNKYHIGKPTINEINEYLSIFYDTPKISIDNYTGTFTMSDIQHICITHKDNCEKAIKEILK